MKMIIIILGLTVMNLSMAAQVKTDCPMMKEQNERTNPKANLLKEKVVKETKSKVVAE